jgi:tetratricopeptide (TPR) repeat protein
LWTEPFRAIRAQHTIKPTARQQAALRIAVFAQRPKLWKARVLHFQGLKPIPYELRDDPLAEPNRGHRDALRLYQDRSVRPSDQQLSELQPSKQILYRTAKLDASYWLGLLCYDMQKYSSAVNWLKNRTLDIEPLGSWAASAQYNLARTYEAEGEREKAIGLLKTGKTLQHHGNQLRARQLSEQAGEEESVSEETD